MPEPSLSEISNIVADPERGSGTPAYTPNNGNLVQMLNYNAQSKAQNDWNRYNLFLENLKGVYKNQLDTNSMEVADQDREYLKKRSGEIFSKIAESPSAIYSPDLQNNLSELRAEATESKMNRTYDWAHRAYLAQNNELNNDVNQKRVNDYWSKPLGKRDPYTLHLPVIFDVDKFHKGIWENIKRQIAESSPVGLDGKSPGNAYIREVVGHTRNKDEFMKAWNGGVLMEQDKNGQGVLKAVNQMYAQLPPEMRQKYDGEGGVTAFWNDMGEKTWGSKDPSIFETTKDVLHPDSNYLKPEELFEKIRHNKATEGIGWMKAKAYNDNIRQQLKFRKTEYEQSQFLDDLYKRNLVQQPTLITGHGGQSVSIASIKSENSLPLYTIQNGNVSQLIPIGGTPVYRDEDYKDKSNGTLKEGAKPLYYKGGEYKQQYIIGDRALDDAEVIDLYENFKKKARTAEKAAGQKEGTQWSGGLNDFLRESIKRDRFKVKIIGANGSTDNEMSRAAQMIISNKNQKKYQDGVFSNGEPPTDEGVTSESQGSSEYNRN